jgi:hypothetical protein
MWTFQRVGPVLGQHGNIINAGIDAVGQGKIDNSVLAGKGDCRFGSLVREHRQACSSPSAIKTAIVRIVASPLNGFFVDIDC